MSRTDGRCKRCGALLIPLGYNNWAVCPVHEAHMLQKEQTFGDLLEEKGIAPQLMGKGVRKS